ncbi:pyridoxamine 5'-phosphate oxidase family protein [Yinghuangia seranimata]|uniref:pyridoxamine 5'-phosphate oxidase family protein n=1 Tax=Yinghuangia seranimata TaxID=408067 RepID=UPI00248BA45F|nr:pyridoxamine 5'-phosphate oxidase family protein [Yinghuangia seranimata]MDI2126158.1 pyridoxamine 5'-phosphate oxidase family protein [Yinghuangia seranimata]
MSRNTTPPAPSPAAAAAAAAAPETPSAPPVLPTWPRQTVAVLATTGGGPDEGPHAVPVSAPVRAGDQTILLTLRRTRDSLARLRASPRVAMLFLAEDDTAFTARGTARVAADPMSADPDYACVEITVDAVDDHRAQAFTVTAGVGREWLDPDEKRALARRVEAMQQLAVLRWRCRGAAERG